MPDVNKKIDSLIKGNTANEHLTRGLGITLEPHLQPRGPFLENADNFLGPFYFAMFAYTIQKFQIILKRAIQ